MTTTTTVHNGRNRGWRDKGWLFANPTGPSSEGGGW